MNNEEIENALKYIEAENIAIKFIIGCLVSFALGLIIGVVYAYWCL